ncbi:MAG: hypothetical protein KAG64_06830 [Bacteroidales bacterium]|nr:hypothetical protein [Bacteroidales bacterium]
MRKSIFIILLTLGSLNSFANDSLSTHFELISTAFFWHPTAAHLIGVDNYWYQQSHSEINGFGNSFGPSVNFNYYLNNRVGITTGYNYLPFKITKEGTSNTGFMRNLRIGVIGRVFEQSILSVKCSTGLNMTSYSFQMPIKYKDIGDGNLTTNGFITGVFFTSGISLRIYKSLYFHTSFDYTYIPSKLIYTYSYKDISLTQTEITNIGGIGFKTGLEFRF